MCYTKNKLFSKNSVAKIVIFEDVMKVYKKLFKIEIKIYTLLSLYH